MEVEIRGVADAKIALAKLNDKARRAIKQALGEASQQVVDTAKMNVRNGHSRTGTLANSINWRRVEDETTAVFASANHAPYHEFGTGQRGKATYTKPPKSDISFSENWAGRPAYPFLHPAVKQNEKRIRQTVGEAIERSI